MPWGRGEVANATPLSVCDTSVAWRHAARPPRHVCATRRGTCRTGATTPSTPQSSLRACRVARRPRLHFSQVPHCFASVANNVINSHYAPSMLMAVGVRRGVSKGVKDCCRPPTLRVDHPASGVACLQGIEG
jgi:hypothetical protein